MAPSKEDHQTNGRTWRNHFPDGDLWVFGYGYVRRHESPPLEIRLAEELDLEAPATRWYVQAGAELSIACLNPEPREIKGCLDISMVMYGGFGSTDHRGTPEVPGRVVTVIEREFWETLDDPLAHLETADSSTSRVWGAAYHIPASHAEEVHDYLDEREIDGYTAHFTPFRAFGSTDVPETKPITCMVYIGQPTNPQFLRDPARREPQDVAEVISRGRGQSGKNTEYLYLLEKALESVGLGSADGHVTDLVRRVNAIEGADETAREENAAERDLRKSLSRSEEEAHQNIGSE